MAPVIAFSCPGETRLSRNRITPAGAALAQRAQHVAGRLGAGEAQDHELADLLLERQLLRRALGALDGPAARASAGAARRSSPRRADHGAEHERDQRAGDDQPADDAVLWSERTLSIMPDGADNTG